MESAHLSVGRGNGAESVLRAQRVCVGGWRMGILFPIGKKKTFMIRSKKQKCVPVSEKLVWDLISSKKGGSACGTD